MTAVIDQKMSANKMSEWLKNLMVKKLDIDHIDIEMIKPIAILLLLSDMLFLKFEMPKRKVLYNKRR